ncbi:MAG: glycosyltransferase family 8 protein [Synergistaceae bacterium]|nr:glycosyltransferase family 8 protein [Synergistaceae bacterium]
MTSIFENTKSKVIVHILHDDTLTDENRQKFIRTAEKYSQGLELHDVSERAKHFGSKVINASKKWTIGAMYRLFIPEVMPDVKNVIYFDCDILVNMDIAELWALNDGKKTLYGAVDLPGDKLNTSFFQEKMRILLNGSRPENYINSGVLVMNLDSIRQRGNLFTLATDWIAARGGLALAPDQDALNAVFHGDIQLIDSRFNTNVRTQDISSCIVHMLQSKPWKSMYGLHQDRLYWKMFLRSAWGENVTVDDVVDILNDVVAAQRPSVSYSYSVRHIIRGFCNMIKHRIIPTVSLKYMILHAYYSLKGKLTKH